MTHTQGPWTYESDHTHRQYNIRMLGNLIGYKDEAKHICTVNNLPSHILASRDPATAEANARLIAAAPDMLEAMQIALDMLIDSWGDEQIAAGDDQVANILKRAIAKAMGANNG